MSDPRPVSAARLAGGFGLVAMLLVGIGCGNQSQKPKPTSQPQDFPIEVEVTDTDGNVVPAAPVKLDGTTVGYTGKDGTFTATLREKPGTKIELAIGEIDGYRIVDKGSATEKLQLKRNLSGKGVQCVPVLLHAVTESVDRSYLIWVDTDCDESLPEEACQGLPVRRGDEVVATTDRLGKAHFNLREQPDEQVTVTIETPDPPDDESEDGDDEDEQAPRFEPEDPTYEISLGLEPTIYRLEPTFTDPTEEESDEDDGTTHRPPSPPPSSGGSSGGSAESSGSSGDENSGGGGGGGEGGSKKKKKDEGPIDLF